MRKTQLHRLLASVSSLDASLPRARARVNAEEEIADVHPITSDETPRLVHCYRVDREGRAMARVRSAPCLDSYFPPG